MTSLREEYNQGKNYLSFGAGVNSVALMLWLLDHDIEFEAVFADHGGDYPETYEYVDMLISKDYPITVLKTRKNVKGKQVDLYGKCWEYRMVPSIRFRWCTVDFKVKPISSYVEKPCFQLIGISAEEAHRVKRTNTSHGIILDYPLVDNNINREQCKQIIAAHGLPIPPKSGCYFCPFQRKSEVKALSMRCDGLWEKTLALESRYIAKCKEKGIFAPAYLHASNRPLEVVIDMDQEVLFDEMQPCICHE